MVAEITFESLKMFVERGDRVLVDVTGMSSQYWASVHVEIEGAKVNDAPWIGVLLWRILEVVEKVD